ncbi:NERD domain-containing protein [Virgibacillus ndiopensis]|uniref:NERD domain-containing protein n=1 Tax=Virgibacillus ndiopensis TaxID=2004408 RepID=UPI000C0859C6|nr:NERD domain-containing protein [Virgibacillus ndiopensis]
MIIRRRTKPLPLQKLDAVIPRLSPQFKRLPEMQLDAANRYKGYIGEQKVDYHLELLPGNFTILHDVCLAANNKSFQIDSIVISPHAIFIIEVKNYDGTVTFDTTFKQFTRNNGDKDTGYRYPITQAESSKLKLTNWLHEQNYHDIPVHYLIAVSDPSTIIKVNGDKQAIAEVVMHGEYIPMKVMEIDEKFARSGQPRLESRRIGEAMLWECQEFDFEIVGRYGITNKDILTGVHCPECGRLGMERRRKTWHCTKCGKATKYAHIRAIKDYLLLINSSISNKECRRFLRLPSRSIVTRILQKSELVYQKKHKSWEKA